MKMSLLAIGSSLELDALSTLGFEVMKISKILSEELHSPPLIVVVPTLEKNKTYRLEELHDIISHAVGVRLKWKR